MRQYGFRTFAPLLDESYDHILDPAQRMLAVQREMSRIAALPAREKTELFGDLRQIARVNQARFFDPAFGDQIMREYQTNLSRALDQVDQDAHGQYWDEINQLLDRCQRPQSHRDWMLKLRSEITHVMQASSKI